MQLRYGTWCAAWMACFGMVLPATSVRGEVPAAATPVEQDSATDVTLYEGGKLCGMVVNSQGVPMPSTDVSVSQSGKVAARAKTDALGQFTVTDLRGGVYQVAAGKRVTTLRVWEGNAAPPSARPVAMLVGSGVVVRGQRPFGSLIFSDAIVLGAIIAAAIAIPIAVSKSGKSTPSSS
jgi:hypothetical protein